MMNKQYKSKYLRGVCLGNTIAIVASISNSVVNADETEDFKHFAHEISWKAYASLRVNDTRTNDWYQAKQYSDSIYNVIAKAIADCKMQKNEFNDQVPKNGIVEFKAKPDNANYTDENWNALVLWNFLAEAINGKLKTKVSDRFSKECIEAVGKRIVEYYKGIEGIAGFVNKAVKDIQEYAQALRLYNYLYISCLADDKLYSNVKIQQEVTETTSGIIEIDVARLREKAKVRIRHLKIFYKHRNSVAYQMSSNIFDMSSRFVNLKQDMSIESRMKGSEEIWKYIDNDVATPELQETYVQSREPITEIAYMLKFCPTTWQFIEKLAQKENENDNNKRSQYMAASIKTLVNKLGNPNTQNSRGAELKDIEKLICLKGPRFHNENGRIESDNKLQQAVTLNDTAWLATRILKIINEEANALMGQNAPYAYEQKVIHSDESIETHTNTIFSTPNITNKDKPYSPGEDNIKYLIHYDGKDPTKGLKSEYEVIRHPEEIIAITRGQIKKDVNIKYPSEIWISERTNESGQAWKNMKYELRALISKELITNKNTVYIKRDTAGLWTDRKGTSIKIKARPEMSYYPMVMYKLVETQIGDECKWRAPK